MKIANLHTEIYVEDSDYFYVDADGNTINITLTAGNRRPVKLKNISRRAWNALVNQVNSKLLLQDEAAIDEVMKNIKLA